MKTFYLFFLAIVLFSCSADDDTPDNCVEFKLAGATAVESYAPTTTTENNFEVTFPVINGCGEFDSFTETTVGNVTTIDVYTKYVGCICTQEVRLLKSVYTFAQTTPGTYTLKFRMTDGNYFTETVIIE